eukprot:TRINITY_DN35813_c0_g1_i1.p1 TRINITY_DN35813_c0_g1~~TRINITY_DN35813_c0_g1_i1.p1  ORF type:complete len:864 (+),score=343.58 TRINITY_DN35813_c0_g1_i1:49-2640(+)
MAVDSAAAQCADSAYGGRDLAAAAAAARGRAARLRQQADARAAASGCDGGAEQLLQRAAAHKRELAQLGEAYAQLRRRQAKEAALTAFDDALRRAAAAPDVAAAAALLHTGSRLLAEMDVDEAAAERLRAQVSSVAADAVAELRGLLQQLKLLVPTADGSHPPPSLLRRVAPLWTAATTLSAVDAAVCPEPCRELLQIPFEAAFAQHFPASGTDPQWPLAYCSSVLSNHSALLSCLAAASPAQSPELPFFRCVAGAAARKVASCVSSAEADQSDSVFMHCLHTALRFEASVSQSYPQLPEGPCVVGQVLSQKSTERWARIEREHLNARVAPLVLRDGLDLTLHAPDLLHVDTVRPSAGAAALGCFLGAVADKAATAAAGGGADAAAVLAESVFSPSLCAYADKASHIVLESEAQTPRPLHPHVSEMRARELAGAGRLKGHLLPALCIAASSCRHLASCLEDWLLSPSLAEAAGARLADCGDALTLQQQQLVAQIARHCSWPFESAASARDDDFDPSLALLIAAGSTVEAVAFVDRLLAAALQPGVRERVRAAVDKAGVAAARRCRRSPAAARAALSAAVHAARGAAPACKAALELFREGSELPRQLLNVRSSRESLAAAVRRSFASVLSPVDAADLAAIAAGEADAAPAAVAADAPAAGDGRREQVPSYVPGRGLLRWASSTIGTVSSASLSAGSRVVDATGVVARLRRAYSDGDAPTGSADDDDIDVHSAQAAEIRARLQQWLQSIPIGGNEQSTSKRHYDVEPLVCFALRRRLYSTPAEGIYQEFVEWQVEDGEAAVASPQRGGQGEAADPPLPPEPAPAAEPAPAPAPEPAPAPPTDAVPSGGGDADGWEGWDEDSDDLC